MEGKKRQSTYLRRMRFLARVLAISPLVIFVYSPLLAIQSLVSVAIPFATGCFIDALVKRVGFVWPFATLGVLLLARAVMTPTLQRLVLYCSRDVEFKLQKRVLESAMDFAPDELATIPEGEFVAKLTRDIYAIGGFVSGFYPRFLLAVSSIIMAGCALYSRSAALGIAFVAFVPLSIAFFCPFSKRFAEDSHLVRKRSDSAFVALFDFFRSLPFLRLLDAERRFACSPRSALGMLKDGNCAIDKLTIVFGAMLGMMIVTGEIFVLGMAGMFASSGKIPVGDVVVYQLLFLTAMQSVQGLLSIFPETAMLGESVDSLFEIFSHKPPKHGGAKFGKVECIEFRNVVFSYPGTGDIPVINKFSASFNAGRIIALVGENGTGKTTLLKLATDALKPISGEITVNGIPMRLLDEGRFRRSIGVVFQENLIVSGTVRDNITLRDPSFNESDIEAAVKMSGLEDVVNRLPDRLDTQLGLGGRLLSGGELQRLAIARALVRNPSVLVFDEATNHLDSGARDGFGHLLHKIAKGRIVFLVTHDKAILDSCDETIFCRTCESASPTYECCSGRFSTTIG